MNEKSCIIFADKDRDGLDEILDAITQIMQIIIIWKGENFRKINVSTKYWKCCKRL